MSSLRRPSSRLRLASALALSASLSLALTGCIEGGAGVTNFIQPEGAVLDLEIDVGDTVPGGFDLLVIRMVSNNGDTLRDTLDSDGLSLSLRNGPTLGLQLEPAFRPRYEVRPLSAWKVDIEALVGGNVVSAGAIATDRIARGDTLRVAVPLASR